MSRSRKKTPKIGITKAASEKEDKVRVHRQGRAQIRGELAKGGEDPQDKAHRRKGSRMFAKDGKYWSDHALNRRK